MDKAALSTQSQLSLRVVVLVVAASAPIALGFETLIRTQLLVPMMGAELEELRAFYWPTMTDAVREAAMTRAAWVLVGVSCLAGLLGLALQRRASRRGVEAAREHADPHARARVIVRDQLLMLTSIPQIPAVLATLCFSFGAQLGPVIVCMVVSTVFVLVQGWVGERLLLGLA